MAGKKNEELVEVRLPILPDPNAPQQEFYSVNGKNWLIQRGVPVKVPKALAEVIDRSEAATLYAIQYANSIPPREV